VRIVIVLQRQGQGKTCTETVSMSIRQNTSQVKISNSFIIQYLDKTPEELYGVLSQFAQRFGHVNEAGHLREIFFYSQESLTNKRQMSSRMTFHNESAEELPVQKKSAEDMLYQTNQANLKKKEYFEELEIKLLEVQDELVILANKIAQIQTLMTMMRHQNTEGEDREYDEII